MFECRIRIFAADSIKRMSYCFMLASNQFIFEIVGNFLWNVIRIYWECHYVIGMSANP